MPLDALSPTAAYSTRKLRTAYGGSCLRVQRASDSTELDIGFAGNALDTASLLTFCAATDGNVTTWYDQSGSGRDMTQATFVNMPEIVVAGSLVTVNSNPAVNFTPFNQPFLQSSVNLSSFIGASAWTAFGSVVAASGRNAGGNFYNTRGVFMDLTDGSWGGGFDSVTPALIMGYTDNGPSNKNASVTIAGFPLTTVACMRWDKTTLKAYSNGGTGTSIGATNNIYSANHHLVLGSTYSAPSVGGTHDGQILEVIIFDTQLSASDTNTLAALLATYLGSTWTDIS